MDAQPDTADLDEDIATLQSWVAEAKSIVGFTGAGISTECGVPDFRSPGSPWLKHPPMPFQEFMASPEARREAWRRKFALDDSYRGAKPGRAHLALAALVADGRMAGIITQNIDGLHHASGVPSERIAELHGNGTYAACLDCGLRHEIADIRTVFEASGEPPGCASCGGIVKSATISFGQALPGEAMAKALDMTLACDLFIAIGSSLVVQPAASFPVVARRNGARLVIVNRDPTPLDEVASLTIRAEIGVVIGALAPT